MVSSDYFVVFVAIAIAVVFAVVVMAIASMALSPGALKFTFLSLILSIK